MSRPQLRLPGDGPRTQALSPPPLAFTTLPAKVDHRATLSGCLTIHSQGSCGWCVAHATTASLEAMLCSQALAYQRISEPHLWSLGRETSGSFSDCEGGWYLGSAYSTLTASTAAGQLLVGFKHWPYIDDVKQMNADRPAAAALKVYGRYGAKPAVQGSVWGKDVGGLKAALASGANVGYSVPTFKGTGWSYGDKSFGKIGLPQPAPAGDCECETCPGEPHCLDGYHAILIVGYDDADGGWFEFVNSWGEWWGDSGYGKLSYDFIASHGNGGQYVSALTTKAVPDLPPTALIRFKPSKPSGAQDYPFDASKPTGVPVGATVYLSSAGSADPEGAKVTRAWEVIGPAGYGLWIYDHESETSDFLASEAGTYQVRLTVREVGPGGQAATSTLALAVGAAPATPDVGVPDAPRPDVGVGYGDGSSCATPAPLALPASPVTVPGDTSGVANELADAVSCGSSWTYDGPQRYYRVSLTAGQSYSFTAQPGSSWDVGLYLFPAGSCGAASINAACAGAFADTYGDGAAETLSFTPAKSGDYLLAVDSYDAAAYGAYTLTVAW